MNSHEQHSCCVAEKPALSAHVHQHGPVEASWKIAHHATVHCLSGCVIGEVVGLMIGVQIGLPVWATMSLAVILAFIVGFSLTIIPLMHRTGLGFSAAWKAVWLGEVISITVMEIVMNAVDYHMGGMQVASIASGQFWQAILVAVPAGYIAAYPVNAWLIGKQLKRCH